MPPDEFKRWLETMNLSDARAAKALGVGSRGTIARYRRVGAPLYIGLACTAYALGLKPWGAMP